MPWPSDSLPVEALDRLLQGRPVMLLEHCWGHLDTAVGVDAQEVAVVGAVMQRREAEPVADLGATTLIPVRDDVRRLQRVRDRQPRDRATPVVGIEHERAELALMQPDLGLHGGIAPIERRLDNADLGVPGEFVRAADRHGATQRTRIPAGQIAGKEDVVDARHQSVEIDQRGLVLEGLAQGDIVPAVRVITLEGIDEVAIVAKGVVVARGAPLAGFDGLDAEHAPAHLDGAVDAPGLVGEDEVFTRVLEPRADRLPRHRAAMRSQQLAASREGGEADLGIPIAHVILARTLRTRRGSHLRHRSVDHPLMADQGGLARG